MKHAWQYCSLGGVVRVKISSGEDIAHLGELDEKYWTVLSCPVDGLDIDEQTLAYMDANGDGKIRIPEVVNAATWLCSSIRDRDLILKGDSELPLSAFDDSDGSGPGSRLKRSAKQILDNLGLTKDSISIAETIDSTAIFASTAFNGDGVITARTAGEDAELKEVMAACMERTGSVPDRSGESGVTAEIIEKFYSECREYSEWRARGSEDMLAYGENTAAAYSACCALKDKMADYFMRCRLLNYDSDVAAALGVKVEKPEDLASCPIARPESSGLLVLKNINPSWKASVDALLALVPEKDFSTADGISEQSWNAFCGRFDAYAAWMKDKKGESVETLGTEKIERILKADRKADLLALVEADSALKEESDSIDDVKKLMYLYRDFGRLLRNYVTFYDFYDRENSRAAFEAGRLFIDQSCCDLCIRVKDMSGHTDMAQLSGMFLIYCSCSSKVRSESFDIVAVMTAGETSDLRPGKNGVFYDLKGNDWDAVITKVVDNPVSISQAFWSPYRKFWDFCVGLISKSAEEKNEKVMEEMQSKVTEGLSSLSTDSSSDSSEQKQGFDIAKFAGIFAAIGLALGYIGSFLTKLAAGIAATPWWQLLVAIAVIMLIISGPSCFIAWSKLRRRNLGPVLNANGWAINSSVLVNILFGNKLTSVARYPKLNISDPYTHKTPAWKKWLTAIVLLLIIATLVYFMFFNTRGPAAW